MVAKKVIRKEILSIRAAMTTDQVQKKSSIICERLMNHPLFLRAKEIYCYVDFRNEVKTQELMETALQLGKKVAVPKVEGAEIRFYYITSWKDLAPGCMGILEPATTECAEGKEVLVLMPGAVFDRNRNRIGYGGGYYDKYMGSHPFYDSIALAFSCQVLDRIPAEAHDFRPNIIITEVDEIDDSVTKRPGSIA